MKNYIQIAITFLLIVTGANISIAQKLIRNSIQCETPLCIEFDNTEIDFDEYGPFYTGNSYNIGMNTKFHIKGELNRIVSVNITLTPVCTNNCTLNWSITGNSFKLLQEGGNNYGIAEGTLSFISMNVPGQQKTGTISWTLNITVEYCD